MNDADALMEEAADRLLAVQCSPDDQDLRREVEAWLAASDAHRQAWRQLQAAWNMLGDIPAESPAPVPVGPARPVRPAAAGPRRVLTRRRIAGTGMATAAAALGVAVLPDALVTLRADAATGTAETRAVSLPDGTVVYLAPRSAIAWMLGEGRRDVALLRGRAFFEVAPDQNRPFVATTGALTVRVVGTAFDLQQTEQGPVLAAQHGAVVAEYGSPAGPQRRRMSAGDQISLHGGEVRSARVHAAAVGAWRQGFLAVDQMTVREVVDQLRPYLSGKVVIADTSLAARRVAGGLDLRHPDRALEAAVAPFGGKLWRLTPLLLVLTGP